MQLFVRDKQFYRTVVKIAVPVVAQSMITIGVNMMDTFMLGNFGKYQLSGSSLANEFINIFQIMCMGMGYGAAVLTAQYWGQKDVHGLKKIVTIMLRLCLVISTLFSIATFCFPDQIMSLYSNDSEVIHNGILYFRVSAFTFIPTGISLTLTAIMRSVREVKFPLIVSIGTFFVNIFFNWIFIFGHLGAPRLEITGAAIGTLIARLFEATLIGGYFLFKEKRIGYRIHDFFGNCKAYYKRYVSYCVPVLISDSLLGIGNSAVAVVIGHLGASFAAANAIIAQVTRMSTVFNQGVSSASSVITGNTLGEGDVEKTYRQSITFLSLSVIIGLFAGVIILIICPFIITGFTLDQETEAIAFHLMYAVAITVVFQATQSVLTKGVLRGGGDTKFLMFADILFLWLVSIPFGYVAGLVLHLPSFWIYVALKADWIIKSIWCAKRLLNKKWINRVS